MKFDARVLGIPNHLAAARKVLNKQDYQLEADKFREAETKLIAKLPEQKKAVADFFKRKSEVVSHFRCDRHNFLRPVQEFACFVDGTTVEEVVQENAWTASLHLVLLGGADSLIVPFDFSVPVNVQVPGRTHPYTLCSAPRMLKELEGLDEYVAVEHTMGVRQFDAFVELSKAAMERFEKQEGVGRRFWAKWGVAALRGLIQRAQDAGLCVVLDPQFGEVPVSA